MDCQAVIFDLFHTLIAVNDAPGKNTYEILGISKKAWNDQLFLHSTELSRGKIKDVYQIIEMMAHAIEPSIPLSVIKEATENRLERFRYALKFVKPVTLAVLKQIKALNKKIGLISNVIYNDIIYWNESPFSKYFDSTIFSCNVGYVKPEREIYLLGLKDLKVQAHQCIFVGDGGSDELRGAKEIGMKTVLTTEIIARHWPETINERKKYADYVINNLAELLDLIH